MGPDIVVVTLEHADGLELPPWEPGAHISILLPPGIERQYSLCGESSHTRWRIAVKRVENGRGGSQYIHDSLGIDDVVKARMPRNNFRLVSAERYLFIAGGIGITPLLPMIRDVAFRGLPWELHFAIRNVAAVPFENELRALPNGAMTVYADDAGKLLQLAKVVHTLQVGFKVFCCGPVTMMDELEALAAGWEPSTLHLERFSSAQTVSEGDHPFTVYLEKTGRSVEVGADETILDAVRRAGVTVQSSCREGLCGTCETPVLSGAVDHRDSILTPGEKDEGNYMMICVSRASDLKLRLDL
ncbi:oxidoreductase (plasmid) [Rhodococcus sp. 21391]|nr:oxidoreductase [Rhodococcus sp. 21391]